MEIKTSQAANQLKHIISCGLVPYLTGSPGMGKSAIAKQIAEDFDLCLIDIRLAQCDITDICGFPQIDKERHKASYVPMSTFPLEGDELPTNPKTGKPHKGWLLFMDELSSAPLAIQAASYQIVLDKMVGQYRLHPEVRTMAAGNLATDKAIVNSLSTAMQSRLIHLTLAHGDHKFWLDWAEENDIDQRILSYIRFSPDSLHRFDPNHADKTFPCQRTWEFTNALIKNRDPYPIKDIAIIAGTIGEGAAREFLAFCDIYQSIPTFMEIVRNPLTVKFDPEPSTSYALTGLISKETTEKNLVPVIAFLERMSIEMQVIAMRSIIKRNPNVLMGNDAVDGWLEKHSDVFTD